MDSLRRVYWSDGLFLTPQVFQQQDAFHMGMWKVLWRAMGPNAWGIRQIEIREEALRAGELDVASLEVITRHGDVLRFGIEGQESNCIVLPRSFGEDGLASAEVGVYLAIATRDAHRDNIADRASVTQGSAEPARFVSAEREASDDFHPASADPSTLDMADFVVRFIFDTDAGFASAGSHYDCFQLLRLRPLGTGAERVQSFVPPSVMVGASRTLDRLVRNACAEVTRRTREYEEIKTERSGMRGQEASARDALVKSMLLVLNSANAELKIMLGARDRHYPVMRVHPEVIYNRLRVLVCELSTFSSAVTSDGAVADDETPTPIPDYDHEDPYPGFEVLSRTLARALGALVVSLEGQVELVYDGRHFAAELPDSFFGGTQASYYLAIDADNVPRDRVIHAVVHQTCKLSSAGMAEQIIDANVPGIDLEPLQFMPIELSLLTSRYACFRLDKGHRDWGNVEKEKAIKLWAPDFDPAASKILMIQSEPE
jgi:type VI secretion system ImpJ/VasE family protein